jgi:ATP-binding cassette, subfamily C (CFTR/MRP), member 1
MPLMISPVITFAIILARANGEHKSFDLSTVYTSTSALTLLTEPLSQLFQVVPMLAGAGTCFERISAFLSTPVTSDARGLATLTSSSETIVPEPKRDSIRLSTLGSPDLELYPNFGNVHRSAIKIRRGAFGWAESQEVLHEIDVDIPSSRCLFQEAYRDI